MDGKALHKNLINFLEHLDSIKDTLPMTMVLLKPYDQKVSKELMQFAKNEIKIIEVDGVKSASLKYEDSLKFKTLTKSATTSRLAAKIIPESLFVSLISQYDSFLNNLLRIIFQIKPEILNGSQRNLTFSELVAFENIGKARDFIIEKEVESVLRESHTSHFEYLENKLVLTLRSNLQIWSTFIEITERRNLFVHCDGKVTSQYLNVCQKGGVQDLEKVVTNDRLNVSTDYFNSAYLCLYEIAVKLTHTIWRKLLIIDLEEADHKLNNICYDLLNVKNYKLADTLLEFACSQKRFFNDSSSNFLLVNRSLSKLLNNEVDEAKKIISSKDWSASGDEFKLAYNVIMENDKEVYALMEKIGDKGDIKKGDYKVWPLFNFYRKKQEFKAVYKKIFNEDFLEVDIPSTLLQRVLSKKVLDGIETTPKRVINKKASSKKDKKTASNKATGKK